MTLDTVFRSGGRVHVDLHGPCLERMPLRAIAAKGFEVQRFPGTAGCQYPLDLQVCSQIMGQVLAYAERHSDPLCLEGAR